jgi:F0F1-type ATP synthase assembly protein I
MKQDENVWAQASRYMSLAFVLPVSMGVGFAMGWGLDKLFRTHFLWMIFLGLGLIAGFVELFRQFGVETKRDGG